MKQALDMCAHNLQTVGGEVLAKRLGWSEEKIARLRDAQEVLRPIQKHIEKMAPSQSRGMSR